MPDIVTSTAEQVRQTALEYGLVAVDGRLTHSHLPILRWSGTWPEYLKVAKAAGARLLYVDMIEFNAAELLIGCVTESLDDSAGGPSEQGNVDLVQEAHDCAAEAMQPWADRDGQVARVVCTWVVEGVAHVWKAEQQWFVQCRRAVEKALDDLCEGSFVESSTS